MLWCVMSLVLLGASTQGKEREWRLVWEDNFDFFDPSKWEHEVTAWGGGNNEFQVYTPDERNSYVRDGKLFIVPTLLQDNINPLTGEAFGIDFLYNGYMNLWDMYGYCTDGDNNNCVLSGDQANIPPIMSARLRTANRFSYRFGRAEIRAKMPVGDWIWPALWMLPEGDWAYGGWPNSGEIDIIETIGNRDLKMDGGDIGTQKMGSTLHWGIDPGQNRWYLTSAARHNYDNNFGDYFHDYVLEWDENGISWTVDGEFLYRVPDPPINEQPGWNFYDYGAPWQGPNNPWAGASPMAPFDQPFHFIFNVAVGGTLGFIPDGAVNRGNNEEFGKPWGNWQSKIDAMWSFWGTRDRWHWTWEPTEGENAAMQVDYIRVYAA